MWAWAGGTSDLAAVGSYPAQSGSGGWFSSDTYPSARQEYGVSVDLERGLMYVLGGLSIVPGTYTETSDLWVTRGPTVAIGVSPTITPSPSPTPSPTPLRPLEWRWLAGSQNHEAVSVCGAAGQFSNAYSPGARDGSVMAHQHGTGNTYLFGGAGFATASVGKLGDVWTFRQTAWTRKGEWAWLGGKSSSVNYSGQYSGETPYPAARGDSVGWVAQGSLYIFAGSSGSLHNDWWAFNVSTSHGQTLDYEKAWRWLGGSSETNQGAVFGTKGVPSPANRPGAVYLANMLSSDSDGASALVHGGIGYVDAATGKLASLFKYNGTINQWTWMSGVTTLDTAGIGGASGEFAANYYPGGRYSAASVYRRASGLAYLMCGDGYSTDQAKGSGGPADVWAYRLSTNEWAYVAGDSVNVGPNSLGSYGHMLHYSPSNHPGARRFTSGWADPNMDDMLSLGFGDGYAISSSGGYLTDMWGFNTTSKMFVWTSGRDDVAHWNSLLSDASWFSSANMVGCKSRASSFTDNELGLMYIFGGGGCASSGTANLVINTLWATRGVNQAAGSSPTPSPSASPSATPSASPTPSPTSTPTSSPTSSPTSTPSASPTSSPTSSPSASPTTSPSPSPPPVLQFLEPAFGPVYGETVVRIFGQELQLVGSNIQVTFKDQTTSVQRTVAGHRIGTTEIQCTTPALNETSGAGASATVTVSGTMSTLTAPTAFKYYANVTLARVFPPLAPRKGSGAANIILYGSIPATSPFKIILTDSVNSGNYVEAIGTNFANGNSTSFDVAGVTPSQVQSYGGMNVTVEGSGFFASDFIRCRFSTDIGIGFYVSSTVVQCLVPKVENGGVKNLQVSMDLGNTWSATSIKINIVEFVSEECRRKTELPTFQPDRLQLGLHYFPNLAVGAAVTTSARRDNYDFNIGRALNPSQLVDGDRCCEFNLQTEGYKCGTIFNLNSSASELASVIVDIGFPAYVDEVLTTWFRPCKNLPDPGYTIEARSNVTEKWNQVLERSVWKENPCRTLTGDNGPTAFCADFFEPVVAQQFRITFNNSAEHFLVGAGTDGGWLMEFEVHGIFLKTPYQLSTKSPPLFVRSGIEVPVPPMVVESFSILGGTMDSSDSDVSRQVSLRLLDSADKDVTSQFLVGHAATAVQGSQNFSSVALKRPLAGSYSLVYYSEGLKSCNASITVSQGKTVYLQAESSSEVYASADVVTLKKITVKAYDEGTNWCSTDPVQRNVTVESIKSTLVLNGPLLGTMVNGVVEFDGVQLTKPTDGLHQLGFNSSGLRQGLLTVTVGVGLPYQLALDPYTIDPKPSNDRVNIPSLVVKVLDAGGAWVQDATNQVKVTLTPMGSGSTATLLGNDTVDAVLGKATFAGLQLAAPATGSYSLQFTAVSLPNSPALAAPVTVIPGPAKSIFIENVGSVSATYLSAVYSQIDPIILGAKDAGGNRVYIERDVHASLDPRPEMLSGNTMALMLNGTAVVSNLTILSPPAGNYELKFSVAGLIGTQLSIRIDPGLAISLKITSTSMNQTHDSVSEVALDPITFQAIDAGGSLASTGRKEGETVDPTLNVTCETATLIGAIVSGPIPASTRTVTMSGIKMKAPKAGIYTLKFTSSNGLIPTTSTVDIGIGPPHSLTVANPPSSQCDPPCFPQPETGSTLCCKSSLSTKMPKITVKALDAGGDEVGSLHPLAQQSITVHALFSANASTADWTGSTTASQLVNGEAVFAAASLNLLNAKVGRYVIDFAATGLFGFRLPLDIQIGDAARLAWVPGSVSDSTSYPVVQRTKLNDVHVQLLDAGETVIAKPKDSKALSLVVDRVDDSTALITTVVSYVNKTTGIATWTDLFTLKPPKIGQLRVKVSGNLANGNEEISFLASIHNGPAVSFSIDNPPSTALKGKGLVRIPTLSLTEYDAGGNRAAINGSKIRVVNAVLLTGPASTYDRIRLNGTTSVLMQNGRASLDDLWLTMPDKDVEYRLNLTATGLPPVIMPLDVVAGDPYALLLTEPAPAPEDVANGEKWNKPRTSNNVRALNPIRAMVVDSASNAVGGQVIKVTVDTPPLTLLPYTLEGTKSLPVDANTRQATFGDLILRGVRGEVYNLVFSVDVGGDPNATAITQKFAIEIETCDDNKKNSEATPPDRWTCRCPVGYAPNAIDTECVICPSDEYKAAPGPYPCAKCESVMANTWSREGATAATDCKCKATYYYALDPGDVKGNCTSCKTIEGSDCEGGSKLTTGSYTDPDSMGPIVPTVGYWRAASATNMADIVKCPSNSSCTGGANASACDPLYHGPLCSLCIPGYAMQGTTCLICSDFVTNVAILVVSVVAIFLFLRFYVNKQMLGGRSPQATVLKVIVSYVQVIAFVGGFKARWMGLMSGFFTTLGAAANVEVLSIQPIGCVFNANFYVYFIFYSSLIVLSFCVPFAFYHFGSLVKRIYNCMTRQSRAKKLMRSRSATHTVNAMLDVSGIAVAANASESEVGLDRKQKAEVGPEPEPQPQPQPESERAASLLEIMSWPVKLLLFHIIPGIPRVFKRMGRILRRIGGWIMDRIAGEGLDLSNITLASDSDLDGDSDNGIDNAGAIRDSTGDSTTAGADSWPARRRRRTSVLPSSKAAEIRRHAKSVGAVLFEEDPTASRSVMSATKSAFWILFFLLLPTVIKNTMELFRCRKLGNTDYIYRDLGLECNTITHNIYKLVFWLGLVPLITVLVLYVLYKNVINRKRRGLVRFLPLYNMCWMDPMGFLRLPPNTDPAVAELLRKERVSLRRLRKYLFLFSGYRTEGMLFMWDLVIMARKIAIAAILVFARDHLVLQVFFSLLVFVLALCLHLVFRPFDDNYAREKKMPVLPSTLEFISIIATIFTLMAGLLFNFRDVVLTKVTAELLDWILLAVNVVVLLAFVFLLFQSLRGTIAGKGSAFAKRQLQSSASQRAAMWWRVGVSVATAPAHGSEIELEPIERVAVDVGDNDVDSVAEATTSDQPEKL